MVDANREYYLHRAAQEREMAERSAGEVSRSVHERLATAYTQRAEDNSAEMLAAE